jgi:ABC-2 type transport system ATP-binding protein
VTAVRVTGLTKAYAGTSALAGVDLEVDEGQIHGLLGPNGAGKTTLLRVLFGLVRADGGSVELFGTRYDARAGWPLDGVAGFVEDPRFYPHMSAQANLELLALLDTDGSPDRIPELVELVGLSERRNDRVGAYSTGMRQRLGIAAALLRGPRLLLLDEPTAGLDPGGIRDFGALLRDLAASGVAVLVSSHQISEVEDACDAFTVLRRGVRVWSGSVEQLRAEAPGSGYRLVTSDDERAVTIIGSIADVEVTPSPRGDLVLFADDKALDGVVQTLGRADVTVRRLELLVAPLESMFFSLTRDDASTAPSARELAEHALSTSR